MARLPIFVFLVICFISLVAKNALSQPQVPCYFIFGDSLSDPGNNNNLKTQAKANYPPYGVDFPNRQATGRFTNGKTVVDFIAGLLGFPAGLIPSSIQSASGSQLVQGVNYASGAAGVLEDTGSSQGDRLNFAKQVELHQATVTRVTKQLGSQNAAMDHLKQCIYTVGIGSNDYINNYFMPDLYTSSKHYTPEQFAKLVADEYAAQLNNLYEYGARKVALFGIGQIGFTPYELNRYGPTGAPKINAAVALLNEELKSLVDGLNGKLSDARFTFLNTTGITSGGTPLTPDQLKPCCQVQPGGFTCIPNKNTICPNRQQAIFFDMVHPTEVANAPVAKRYYTARDPTDKYPLDIQELAQLKL